MKPQLRHKLNLSVILDPRPNGPDVVTGTLPGAEKFEIVVARRRGGWKPLLRVTLAGHVIYFDEASESDRAQFDELRRRARASRDDEPESEERLLKAAEAAGLLVPGLLL